MMCVCVAPVLNSSNLLFDMLNGNLPGHVLAAPASALCGLKGVLTPGGPRARPYFSDLGAADTFPIHPSSPPAAKSG